MHPGHLIVLEGLDATGKSTFLAEIENALPELFTPGTEPLLTHQPSGAAGLGQVIYELTEGREMEPLTRQLLHLASHSEHYATQLIPALAERSVIMDRCWWSTVAYGFYGGRLEEQGYDLEWFLALAQKPAQEVRPSVVFLFTEPYLDDRHNTEEVKTGYWELAERYADIVCFMPQAPLADRLGLFYYTLQQKGIIY